MSVVEQNKSNLYASVQFKYFSQLVNLRKPIAFLHFYQFFSRYIFRLGGRSLDTVIITLNEDIY